MRVHIWRECTPPEGGWTRFVGGTALLTLPAWVPAARKALPGARIGAWLDPDGLLTPSGRVHSAQDSLQAGADFVVLGLSQHLVRAGDLQSLCAEIEETAWLLEAAGIQESAYLSAAWEALPPHEIQHAWHRIRTGGVGIFLPAPLGMLPPPGTRWAFAAGGKA